MSCSRINLFCVYFCIYPINTSAQKVTQMGLKERRRQWLWSGHSHDLSWGRVCLGSGSAVRDTTIGHLGFTPFAPPH